LGNSSQKEVSEDQGVLAGPVEEQALVLDARPAERADDFGHAFLDLEKVAVVALREVGKRTYFKITVRKYFS